MKPKFSLGDILILKSKHRSPQLCDTVEITHIDLEGETYELEWKDGRITTDYEFRVIHDVFLLHKKAGAFDPNFAFRHRSKK